MNARWRLFLHSGTALYLTGAAIMFGAAAVDVLYRGEDWLLALFYAASAAGATLLTAMHINVAVDLAEDPSGS